MPVPEVDAVQLPAGLTARPPTGADHARVGSAVRRWWGDLGGAAGVEQRAALLPRLFFDHFADTSTVVEDADGELVAFLVGFLSSSQPGTAYVHFVGVDPAARGRGIARALYARFAALATGRGADTVRCITGPDNRTSIAFHTAMGFAMEPGDTLVDGVPVHLDHDGPGLDRVCFVRSLTPG